MLRAIEIQDDLVERIDGCLEDIKAFFLNSVFPDNGVDKETDLEDLDAFDLIDKANYDGILDECIDSAVPIWTTHLKGLWYLYDDEFIRAYENVHGSDGNPFENDGMSAVFCYIEQEVNAQLDDLVSIWAKEYQESFTNTDV